MMTTRVVYSGRVQGVGFRFRVRMISERHAVAGYVKNLRDGTVELLAQGEPSEIERFLDDIRREMRGLIRGEETSDLETEPFSGFDIAY